MAVDPNTQQAVGSLRFPNLSSALGQTKSCHGNVEVWRGNLNIFFFKFLQFTARSPISVLNRTWPRIMIANQNHLLSLSGIRLRTGKAG